MAETADGSSATATVMQDEVADKAAAHDDPARSSSKADEPVALKEKEQPATPGSGGPHGHPPEAGDEDQEAGRRVRQLQEQQWLQHRMRQRICQGLASEDVTAPPCPPLLPMQAQEYAGQAAFDGLPVAITGPFRETPRMDPRDEQVWADFRSAFKKWGTQVVLQAKVASEQLCLTALSSGWAIFEFSIRRSRTLDFLRDETGQGICSGPEPGVHQTIKSFFPQARVPGLSRHRGPRGGDEPDIHRWRLPSCRWMMTSSCSVCPSRSRGRRPSNRSSSRTAWLASVGIITAKAARVLCPKARTSFSASAEGFCVPAARRWHTEGFEYPGTQLRAQLCLTATGLARLKQQRLLRQLSANVLRQHRKRYPLDKPPRQLQVRYRRDGLVRSVPVGSKRSAPTRERPLAQRNLSEEHLGSELPRPASRPGTPRGEDSSRSDKEVQKIIQAAKRRQLEEASLLGLQGVPAVSGPRLTEANQRGSSLSSARSRPQTAGRSAAAAQVPRPRAQGRNWRGVERPPSARLESERMDNSIADQRVHLQSGPGPSRAHHMGCAAGHSTQYSCRSEVWWQKSPGADRRRQGDFEKCTLPSQQPSWESELGYGAEEASGHWPSGRPRKAGDLPPLPGAEGGKAQSLGLFMVPPPEAPQPAWTKSSIQPQEGGA
ncbi:unnamed protein product [Symbiodinium sp. CCMP2456]|nr:unnamed protein product [Symbiodinium sp. CCMP2456]